MSLKKGKRMLFSLIYISGYDKILPVPDNRKAFSSSIRGGNNMTETTGIGLIVSILALLVAVTSLCYTIISNQKK